MNTTRTNPYDSVLQLNGTVLCTAHDTPYVGRIIGYSPQKVRVICMSIVGRNKKPVKATFYDDTLFPIEPFSFTEQFATIDRYIIDNGIKLSDKNIDSRWYCIHWDKSTKTIKFVERFTRDIYMPSGITVYIPGAFSRYYLRRAYYNSKGSYRNKAVDSRLLQPHVLDSVQAIVDYVDLIAPNEPQKIKDKLFDCFNSELGVL